VYPLPVEEAHGGPGPINLMSQPPTHLMTGFILFCAARPSLSASSQSVTLLCDAGTASCGRWSRVSSTIATEMCPLPCAALCA
jgi:hypothetical protein